MGKVCTLVLFIIYVVYAHVVLVYAEVLVRMSDRSVRCKKGSLQAVTILLMFRNCFKGEKCCT